jgi:hypothetical protein
MFNWKDNEMIQILLEEWFLAQQYEQALVWTVWRVGGVTGTGTTLI